MQKIFLNYDQQIEKLKNEKNLLIDNEAYAKEILKQTNRELNLWIKKINYLKNMMKREKMKKKREILQKLKIIEI